MAKTRAINPRVHGVGTFFPEWLVANEALSWSCKAVYARLAAFSDTTGTAWCSQARLAALTGLSERTVIRVLGELRDQGFLDVLKPGGNDRLKHFSNRYQFVWHKDMEMMIDSVDPEDDVQA